MFPLFLFFYPSFVFLVKIQIFAIFLHEYSLEEDPLFFFKLMRPTAFSFFDNKKNSQEL